MEPASSIARLVVHAAASLILEPSEQRAVALLGAAGLPGGAECEPGAYFRCDLAPVLGGLVQSGDVQAVLSCVP